MIFTAKDLDENGVLQTNATNVKVWNCNTLTTITAPNATEVDVWNCPALTRINAPNATNVQVSYCAALTTHLTSQYRRSTR